MGKKLKLFIDASPMTEARVSGIGHMTAELVKALDKIEADELGFEIYLVVCKDKKVFLEQWGLQNTKVIVLPVRQRIFNLFWKYDLLPPIDLILGKGVYLFPNYKNWRLVLSKSLTFVCDISYIKYPEYIEPKNLEFLTKNIHKWTKRTDKVVTISKNARQEIIDELGVASSKAVLVSCGVDTSVFRPRTKQEVQDVTAEIGVTKRYILYIGNIEPRKNIETLIEAYKQLPDLIRAKHSLLIVGGGGWLKEPILKLIRDSQNNGFDIIHPDIYIPDSKLPALFSGASVLVHPAYYEGFGISPLQAMASGTPVIVADNSSLPEVVGDAGILFNAHDTDGLSVKIEQVLSNKQVSGKFSNAGLARASEYTWGSSADKLALLVRGLR